MKTLVFTFEFVSAYSQPMWSGVCCVLSCFSCVQFRAMLWTVAGQAALSMGFSRQEHWCGMLGPLPGDLPNPGIEPMSSMSPALAGRLFTTGTTWQTIYMCVCVCLCVCVCVHISESLLYLKLTQYCKTTILQFKKEGVLPWLFCQQDTECRHISGVSLESVL